jgi:hypothetical protein
MRIDFIMAGKARLKYPDLEEVFQYFSLGMVSDQEKDRAKKLKEGLLEELLNRSDFWIRSILE